jgi:neutral ceramidase
VGAEALKVLLSLSQTRTADVPVRAKQRLLLIPRRTPSKERLEEARREIELPPTDPRWVWAKETLLLEALLQKASTVETEVQALQIGPVVCVSDPAEYFCAYGLELKKQSGFPMTFPVELANGCVGYVPTEDAFGPQGGGYETRLTSYSNLDITAGTQFLKAGVELAQSLTPMALPKRPLAPPFKAPWSYGNVPPQTR